MADNPNIHEDRGTPGETRSSMSGNAGDVVQARDIQGGVHFHYGRGSQDTAPQQLPRGIRVFVNRLADLDRLNALLDMDEAENGTAVAYVITGTAGVGKTSLALHWAHQVRGQFPDGQLYVDLRGYDPGIPVSPAQALDGFLISLGIPPTVIPQEVEAKASLYRSMLANRKILVILDNAGTVGQVRPLIPGNSRSLTIVTSRSRLPGLVIRDGAHRTSLDTLSEEESVELLRATTADYRVDDSPADIAELARLCAHLPLALRIAAERAASRPHMPLSELIADLRDESGLWEALSTGDPEETEAVRTVFAWSYRALPKTAARLFCLLGLLPGGDFSEYAAAALAETTPSRVRSPLDVLVGACLLENRGFGRYQFHDLLRAYAIDQARFQIPQEEQRAALDKVCTWYLHAAYRCVLLLAHDTSLLFTLDPVPGIVTPDFRDRADAARWYEAERANFVEAVRATASADLPVLTCRLAVVLERLYASFNHFQDWRVTSEMGLEAARRLGDRALEAALTESLGRLFRLTLQLEVAADHHRNAAALHRGMNDPLGVVKALNGLGWVYLFAHRLEEARTALEDALTAVRELDERYWAATVLYSLGYTHLQRRRPDEAEEPLAESLETFRSLGDRLYESMVLTALSLLSRDRGHAAEALSIAQTAVDISREMDNQLWEGTALLYLGKAQRAAGTPGEALVSYQRATVIFRQEGDLSREAMAVEGVGRSYADSGRPSDAAEFHRYAASVHRQIGDRWKLAVCLGNLAAALTTSGEPGQARAPRAEALSILQEYQDEKSAIYRSRMRAEEEESPLSSE